MGIGTSLLESMAELDKVENSIYLLLHRWRGRRARSLIASISLGAWYVWKPMLGAASPSPPLSPPNITASTRHRIMPCTMFVLVITPSDIRPISLFRCPGKRCERNLSGPRRHARHTSLLIRSVRFFMKICADGRYDYMFGIS